MNKRDELAEKYSRERCEGMGYVQWHNRMESEVESFSAGYDACEKEYQEHLRVESYKPCPECGYVGCYRGRKACDAEIDSLQSERDRLKAAIEQIQAEVKYHRQAYGLDIFPNSEVITPQSSTDNISARMGRHMCDVFLGYIEKALGPTNE